MKLCSDFVFIYIYSREHNLNIKKIKLKRIYGRNCYFAKDETAVLKLTSIFSNVWS